MKLRELPLFRQPLTLLSPSSKYLDIHRILQNEKYTVSTTAIDTKTKWFMILHVVQKVVFLTAKNIDNTNIEKLVVLCVSVVRYDVCAHISYHLSTVSKP